MWEIQHNNADQDCFRILILLEIEKTQNQHQVDSCVFSEVTRSWQKSWMCKKQTSVSHSSTEAEIISLDASSRMDGIPALGHPDLVIEVFHCSPNQLNNTKDQVQENLSRDTTSNKHTDNKTKVPTQHDNFDLNNVDCVPSNAKFFSVQ